MPVPDFEDYRFFFWGTVAERWRIEGGGGGSLRGVRGRGIGLEVGETGPGGGGGFAVKIAGCGGHDAYEALSWVLRNGLAAGGLVRTIGTIMFGCLGSHVHLLCRHIR